MKFPTIREAFPYIAAGVLSLSVTGCKNPLDQGPNSISEAECSLDATKMITIGALSLTKNTPGQAQVKLSESSQILNRYEGSTLTTECHLSMRQLLAVREEVRKEIKSQKNPD